MAVFRQLPPNVCDEPGDPSMLRAPQLVLALVSLVAVPVDTQQWGTATLVGGGGTGTATGTTNGVGTSALFNFPYGICMTSTGGFYVADGYNHAIRLVQSNSVSTFAGTAGAPGFTNGVGVAASFTYPYGITMDPTAGTVYVADSLNHALRVITPTGAVSTLAGGGGAMYANGVGTNALFSGPYGIAFSTFGSGTLFVADTGNSNIRAVTLSTSTVALLVGRQAAGAVDGVGSGALFSTPRGIFADATRVWVADTGNHKVRMVYAGNRSTVTLAGGGTVGGSSSGASNGAGVAALFSSPSSLTVSSTTGNVYISDYSNHKVRVLYQTGVTATLVGGSSGGTTTGSADGFGTSALFNLPFGLVSTYDAGSSSDYLYVCDRNNNRIRGVAFTGYSPSPSPTGSPTATRTPTFAALSSPSSTTTPTASPTPTSTGSRSPSSTATQTVSPTTTSSTTSTGTETRSPSSTPTPTGSPTTTPSNTASPSVSSSPTGTSSVTPSPTPSATMRPPSLALFTEPSTFGVAWPVPLNCIRVNATLIGGGGGGGYVGTGGAGAIVTVSFSVFNQSTLLIYVGGGGVGGKNSTCGGSGGGASAITMGGTLLAVAGGGGGGASNGVSWNVGCAGSGGGLPNASTSPCLWAGGGGRTTAPGASGLTGVAPFAAMPGTGPGTSAGASVGGAAGFYNTFLPYQLATTPGYSIGGAGGCFISYSTYTGGGGGGGGYYGGGGGSMQTGTYVSGPGGGGSSIVFSRANLTSYKQESNGGTVRGTGGGGSVSLLCVLFNSTSYTQFQTTTSSPTPTPTLTLTESGTSSSTLIASASSTPSSTSSPTATPSLTPMPTQTVTSTPSPPPTPSASLTPSSTPSGTASPSVSPSSTSSPPLRSCLNRPEGCSIPTLTVSNSVFPLNGNSPIPPPYSFAVASYPMLSAAFTFTLPSLPAVGEVLTVGCSSTGLGVNVSTLTGGAFSVDAASTTRQYTIVVGLKANILTPLVTAMVCTVASTPPPAAPFPRYGALTTLSAPLTVLPSLLPLVAGILAESPVVAGNFRSLGGVWGGPWALPTFDLSCLPLKTPPNSSFDAAINSTTTPSLPYNSTTIASCSSAMDSVEGLAADLVGVSQPGSLTAPLSPFSSIISGSTSALLLAPPSQPFLPAQSWASVTLGGVPCALNWVSPSGTVASITTPTLTSVCASALALGLITSPSAGDCGVATLLIQWGRSSSRGAIPLTAPSISAAVTALTPLPIPAAYPPMYPNVLDAPPPSVLLSTATLAGVSTLPAALLTAASLSSPTQGIRVMRQCTDASFATPAQCAIVNGTAQPYLPPGLICPWGSGDGCVPCPTPGALCPGGEAMVTLPGYWLPQSNSPPSALGQCPSPLSTQRCPGGGGGGGAGKGPISLPSTCGVGYTGEACAACDTRFYSGGGGGGVSTCIPCPNASLLSAILLPLVLFLGGLAAVGTALAFLLRLSLVCSGGGVTRGATTLASASPPTPPSLTSTFTAVGEVLIWLWIAAQGASSLFTQAQGVAPPALTPLYGTLAALQFQGIIVDPTCFTSTPFLSFWVATGGVGVCGLVSFVSLAWLGCWGRGVYPVGTPSLPSRALYAALLPLLLGYGAITSVMASALTCNPPAPMPLASYVGALSDGRALRAALGSGAPTMSSLRSALSNPLLPGNAPLTRLLRSTYIPVATLAANPYQVCVEGAHGAVWYTALGVTLVFTLGLPLIGLAALCRVGKLKGFHRSVQWGLRLFRGKRRPRGPSDGDGDGGGGSGGGSVKSTAASAVYSQYLHAALEDATLVPRLAWYSYWEMGVLTLYTGLVSLGRRARTHGGYAMVQGGIVAAAVVAMGLLSRVQPYTPAHSWKRFPTGALHGLTALTAIINTCIVYGVGGGEGGEVQFTLGLVPLIYAVFLGGGIILAWWFNGYKGGGRRGAVKTIPAAPPLAVDSRVNPLFNHHQITGNDDFGHEAKSVQSSTPPPLQVSVGGPTTRPEPNKPPSTTPVWDRVEHSDGDQFWHCSETGESLYDLPAGGKTACGWEYRGDDGVGGTRGWIHAPSGTQLTAGAPPLDEREAELLIMAHIRDTMVKEAWKTPFG